MKRLETYPSSKKKYYRTWFFLMFLMLFFGCSKKDLMEGPRVILLGLDGLDLTVIHELTQENRLPAFQSLLKDGAYGTLQSYKPLISPLIWTTIATGRTPEDHSILSFSTQTKEGKTILVPSSKRACAAVWNIASAFDVSSTVIGWYATWPSETITGSIVSDRFVQSIHRDDRDTWSGTVDRVTYPPQLAAELYGMRKDHSDISCEQLLQFLNLSNEECVDELKKPFSFQDRVQHLRLILARTDSYHSILLYMIKNHPTRLTMAFFDCTDTTAHLFMPFRKPRQPNVGEEDFHHYKDAVDRMYEKADGILRDVMKDLRAEDTLLIVSDHGFFSGEQRPPVSSETDEGNAVQWHTQEGTILAYGNGIRKGEIEAATVYDVVPTLLAMLNLPTSDELPGKVIQNLVENKNPLDIPEPVDDLDRFYSPIPLPERSAEDSGEVERLESLGYTASGNPSLSPDGDIRLSVEEHINLAVYFEENGELEKALTECERAYQINNSDEKVLGHYGVILLKTGRINDALPVFSQLQATLEELLKHAPTDTRRNDDEHYRSLQKSLSEVLGYKGDIYFKLNNVPEAARHYEDALAHAPRDAVILYNIGLCYGLLQRYADAERAFERLLQVQGGHTKGKHGLAVAKLRQSKTAEARRLLMELQNGELRGANVCYLIGECYRIEGSAEEARQWYRQALEFEPSMEKAAQALEQLE